MASIKKIKKNAMRAQSESFSFHYVYSQTGEISGKSVLRQTEDAINSAGKLAQEAADSSVNAEAIASQALETAQQAQSTASNAETVANKALENVETIKEVVDGYDKRITDAVSTANAANQTANEANQKSEDAKKLANEAKQSASNSEAAANEAKNKAETASQEANEANEAAQAAKEQAQDAQQKAQEASQAASNSAESSNNALNQIINVTDEAYAVRTTTQSLTPLGTVDTEILRPQGNIKVGDTVIDGLGQVFLITAFNEEGEGAIATLSEVVNNLSAYISFLRDQTLTEEQKTQARKNIEAASLDDAKKAWMLGVPNTAAAHNAIYRGDNLLSHFSSLDALSAKVREGDFSNIFIGDWFETTINSSLGGSEKVRWAVAGIDTYLHMDDTECTTNHLTMIAEDCFRTLHVMNPTNTSAGGFEGTQLWRQTIPSYNTALKNAIGAGHVLKHRELLSTSTNNSTPSMAGAGLSGATTYWAWHDAELMIPSEVQVYGSTVFSSSFYDVANRNRQLPYFAMRQDKLVAGLGYGGSRCTWWLSAVSSSTDFALVNRDGNAGYADASGSWVAVRPLFLFA